MFTFTVDDQPVEAASLDEIDRLLTDLEAAGTDEFIVEREPELYITVLYDGIYYVVIYHDYRDPEACVTIDASAETHESRDRRTFNVAGTPTPIPRNICLPKTVGREVIKKFCADGGLSTSVYWLKDGAGT
jgi:hypothetical protein